MANGIAAQIAQQMSKIGFGGNDVAATELFRLFNLDKQPPAPDGLTLAQTQQYYLDMAMPEIKAYIVREARKNKVRELQAQSTIEAQADAVTNL
jgi:hypothetical protein